MTASTPSDFTSSTFAVLQVDHLAADAVHDARDIHAPDAALGASHAEPDHPGEVGQAGHQVPVAAVQGGRAHL
jgi:hypothetical protein